MKILYLLPFFDENRNSFSKLLAPILDELLKKQIPFEIWSSNGDYEGQYQDFHYKKFSINFKYEFLTFLPALFLTSFKIMRWKRQNPDGLVHNVGGGNSLVSDVITSHACHRQYLHQKIKAQGISRIVLNPIHAMICITELLIYRGKTPVISVSSFNTDGLLRYYPSLKEITTIENATNDQERLPVEKNSKTVDFRILLVSNNHRHKGLLPLLKSIQLSQSYGYNWNLTIAGIDPHQAKWEALVTKMALTECVSFLGHVSDIEVLMQQSSILCIPSIYESFGMAYLEASQNGCPCFGTEVGILKNLYANPSGFPKLCNIPILPDELFSALEFFFQHPAKLDELSKSMMRQSKNYDSAKMVDRTMKVYRRAKNRNLSLSGATN